MYVFLTYCYFVKKPMFLPVFSTKKGYKFKQNFEFKLLLIVNFILNLRSYLINI